LHQDIQPQKNQEQRPQAQDIAPMQISYGVHSIEQKKQADSDQDDGAKQ
jgi:hypothetical protein